MGRRVDPVTRCPKSTAPRSWPGSGLCAGVDDLQCCACRHGPLPHLRKIKQGSQRWLAGPVVPMVAKSSLSPRGNVEAFLWQKRG